MELCEYFGQHYSGGFESGVSKEQPAQADEMKRQYNGRHTAETRRNVMFIMSEKPAPCFVQAKR